MPHIERSLFPWNWSYYPQKNKLTAKGYVRVTEGDIIAVMDELEININDGTGIFKNTIFCRNICNWFTIYFSSI